MQTTLERLRFAWLRVFLKSRMSMKDLFLFYLLLVTLLVTLSYFSSGSFSITQSYFGATWTSATILKSNSDFLSKLQLATCVNDASWRARLLHKHKSSLQKLKQSLLWLSCIKDSKVLVAYFLLVFKAKSNKPFGPPVKTSRKQTASKALLRSSSETPSPEEIILKWLLACVTFHRVFNYADLSTQFLLFLPYVSKNKNAFYTSLLRLSGADISAFFDIMVFIYRQGLDHKLKNELSCLLELCHDAVFNKPYTNQNLQPTDVQLILKSHLAVVLSADFFSLSKFEKSCFIFIKRFIQLDEIAVINSLISSVKQMRVTKSKSQSFKPLILLLFEVFSPKNRFFLLEHFIFALKKAIVLYKLNAVSDNAKITFILSLLKSNFTFVSILGSYNLRIFQLFLWVTSLALLLLFFSSQPAHALATGPSSGSLLGFCLNQSLVYGFLVFSNSKKNKKNIKGLCSKTPDGNTVDLENSQTSKFVIKDISKAVLLNEWFIINHLDHLELFDSTSVDTSEGPSLIFKNRLLQIQIKSNTKGLKEVRSGFKRRKKLIELLQSIEKQEQELILKQVHAK